MNAKLLGLLGTSAALIFSAASIASAEPKPVSTASGQPMLLAQKRGGWSSLNLTDAQKEQMRQVRESTRTRIEGVLTQAQRDQLNAAKGQQGQGQRGQRGQRRQVWSSLNLTSEQQAQIRQIRQESKQQMEAILTPEQRQQMEQMRQNRRQNRPQS